ncbi:MAG: Npun_F5749 family FMN-dependent PPOX-type flavoprotein [Bacteroidota bacterium]
MSLAPWRGVVARALHRNRSTADRRYLQLATVRPGGTPANRTVVFRGFQEGTNRLMIVTDRRSEKIPDLRQCPHAEICWYFPKTREQVRLRGPVQVIEAEAPDDALAQARLRAWQALSEASQRPFLGPPPGTPVETPADASLAPTAHPPATFCLVLLDPVWVDHLELRPTPQARTRYERQADASWTQQAVQP